MGEKFISLPRNHFVITKYVISLPRNHFEGTEYVISFPWNYFVTKKYENMSFRGNEITYFVRTKWFRGNEIILIFFHRCPLSTEPLRGHRWEKINVFLLPQNHFIPSKYVIWGVLKVIRRSRATLLFSMGVPIVKSQWVPENRFPPVRQTIPRCTDAISWYLYGDHSANV